MSDTKKCPKCGSSNIVINQASYGEKLNDILKKTEQGIAVLFGLVYAVIYNMSIYKCTDCGNQWH